MGSGKARARTRTIAFLAIAGGLATLAAAAWALASQAGVEVRVIPDRAVWRPGETITGKVVVKNFWPGRVNLTTLWFARFVLRRPDGREPDRRTPEWISYPAPSRNNSGDDAVARTVLEPFSQSEFAFEFSTEFLAINGGYILDDGPYLLDFELPELVVPSRARSARIEVRSPPGEDQKSRIILAGAGGNRLNIVRWNGGIESFDLDSGERVAALDAGGAFLNLDHREKVVFSPDGAACALQRGTGSRVEAVFTVELHELGEGPGRRRTVKLPLSVLQFPDRLRLIDFDVGSRQLRAIGSDRFWEIDRETGAVASMPAGDFPALSRDGKFLVSIESEDVVVYPRHGQFPRGIRARADSDPEARLIGRDGIYLGSKDKGAVWLVSYAGEMLAELHTDATIPVGENSGGNRVLLSYSSLDDWRFGGLAGRLEVWDVEQRKRLSSVEDGKHRAGWLAGAPLKLICGVYRRGEGGAVWLDEVFEVRDPETGGLLRTMDVSRGR